MDKQDIENYINKLQNIEKELMSEDSDFSVIKDLNNILSALDSDIQRNTEVNFNSLEVKIRKLKPNAVIPSYSKDGDAGMDLVATEIISETTDQITYGTGISMEIPKGYVGLVFPRSSIRKYELELTNSVGVIDSGYRGEIQATFKKTNGLDSLKYNVGERGAQIIILPYPQVFMTEVPELSDSERGEGGFGSTGK